MRIQVLQALRQPETKQTNDRYAFTVIKQLLRNTYFQHFANLMKDKGRKKKRKSEGKKRKDGKGERKRKNGKGKTKETGEWGECWLRFRSTTELNLHLH